MNLLKMSKIINLQQYIKYKDFEYFIFTINKMTEIEQDELIDTTENKPKIEADEADEEPEQQEQVKRLIDYKPVSKLTEDEKNYLLNLYKNGGEDNHFKVYFYKNGTNKIVKKKQPPQRISAKLLEKIENSKKPSLTNEQLLMEHVFDLEAKIATLQQKHKKLKKYYKSLHEDIYADDDNNYVVSSVGDINEPIENVNNTNNDKAVEQNNNGQINTTTNDNNNNNNEQTNNTPNVEQNYQYNYINRLRRQPKGYRRMMSFNGY